MIRPDDLTALSSSEASDYTGNAIGWRLRFDPPANRAPVARAETLGERLARMARDRSPDAIPSDSSHGSKLRALASAISSARSKSEDEAARAAWQRVKPPRSTRGDLGLPIPVRWSDEPEPVKPIEFPWDDDIPF